MVEFGRVWVEQHETVQSLSPRPVILQGSTSEFSGFLGMQDLGKLLRLTLCDASSFFRIGEVQVFVYDGTKQSAELRINHPP